MFYTHGKRKAKFCTISLILWDLKGKDERFWNDIQQAFPKSSLLLTPVRMQFLFFRVAPEYVKFSTVLKDLFMLEFCPAVCSRNINIQVVLWAFYFCINLLARAK